MSFFYLHESIFEGNYLKKYYIFLIISHLIKFNETNENDDEKVNLFF